MNLNKVLFAGNLADPELIHIPKGTAVVNVSLAVNEFYNSEDGERQQNTTFIDVKVWGQSAENLAKLASKGQEILIDGSSAAGFLGRQGVQPKAVKALRPR